MLQRAASNAYSWWWASHIRTKQSKWMEQNLQDMEEKVTIVLKLIEEDGDSFAKRAEMYYKKRPELIHFVEESYRAYRALAERYDHISTELQNANNTIASVFPEQVQFAMDDDDEYSPRFKKKSPENQKENVPKVPSLPTKDFKGLVSSTTKKLQQNIPTKGGSGRGNDNGLLHKSGLSKAEGIEEMDRLQKRILALQTEKEFFKSSYEGVMAKYWEIDNEIKEMQEKVCGLQDEFGEGRVIEDDEARKVMAEKALKSCKETLDQLQEKQERSFMEAEVEHKRVKDARNKLDSLKKKFLLKEEEASATMAEKNNNNIDTTRTNRKDEEEASATMESLTEKIKEHFEVSFGGKNLTVTEMAEKIDELVNKVIKLETAVSSQTSLILRLRNETDELQALIRSLEDDKENLVDGKEYLRNKVKDMEEKLQGIQVLNQSVEEQNNHLRTHFTEAHCNLDHLSEKIHTVKPDEEADSSSSSKVADAGNEFKAKPQNESEEQERGRNMNSVTGCKNLQSAETEKMLVSQVKLDHQNDGLTKGGADSKEHDSVPAPENGAISHESSGFENSKKCEGLVEEEKVDDGHQQVLSQSVSKVESKAEEKVDDNHEQASSQTFNGVSKVESKAEEKVDDDQQVSQDFESKAEEKGQELEPDWKQLYLKGIDEREKNLLLDYTTMLRNNKDTKKELTEVETNNQNSQNGLFEITLQLKELKSTNALKDEEIRSLRQKLRVLQTCLGDNDTSTYPSVEPVTSEKPVAAETPKTPQGKEDNNNIGEMLIEQQQEQTISAIEQKLRMNIDELLEENLDFWFRISNTFQQVQQFEIGVKDLVAEVSRLEEKQNLQQGGSHSSKYNNSIKSDVRALYKHLREVQSELNMWVEKSVLLKEELKNRFSSLCDIQEEITQALKASAEDDDFKFTSFQAAKFQGEILNMKQENNKVADELQTGLDHVTTLQLEVDRTLAKLTEDHGLSRSRSRQSGPLQHSDSRSGVPLSSFIFGVKPKKQKTSIFSCVHPALHWKNHGLRSGNSNKQ